MKKKLLHKLAFGLLLATGLTTSTFAQPGANDPTFNTIDVGSPGDGAGFNDFVLTTVVQPDGKILAGGGFTMYNSVSNSSRIARLNSDGSIDPSFTIGTGFNNYVYTIALQSDGKIVVGGSFTSFNGTGVNRIARLNTDGSLDLTFFPGTGFNSDVATTVVQPDGKIIVGGAFTSFNGAGINRIARLNTDGSLDAAFNPGTGFNANVRSINIQSDGKIIAAGEFTSYNGIIRTRIARILRDCPTPSSGTDTRTECAPYAWIDGAIYTTNNTTATHTIAGGAANGCDSIVTLNLTIKPNATGTDTRTECAPYTWIDNVVYTANNTTATHTIAGGAANGCDSIVTLNLTITVVNTNVSVGTSELTADHSGAAYQWIDCNNGNADINGETSQSFAPAISGSYAVRITANGCTEVSACQPFSTVGLQELTNVAIKVYPNPTNTILNIDISTSLNVAENTEITIVNLLGETVMSATLHQQHNSIDVSRLQSGIYFINSSKQLETIKFIKE
jgi:uncharacterized delta-60 repeat protein